MSDRLRKQTVLITSIVLGVVSMILMGLVRHHLLNVPFIKKIMQLKNLGVDSMKDFLEVSEINLRVRGLSQENDVEDEEGTESDVEPEIETVVTWNTDGSKHYVVFISPEYISKLRLLRAEDIEPLHVDEIGELRESTNWIRKIEIHLDHIAPRDQDEDGVNEEEIMGSCKIPFRKFNCRIRSKYGRISKHLSYPTDRKAKLTVAEVDCWLIEKAGDHYLYIREPNRETTGSIFEYRLVFYMEGGKGLERTIPPFRKFAKFKLGKLPPSLCYLTGMRTIGPPLEQFVGWIHEKDAFDVGIPLDEYLP